MGNGAIGNGTTERTIAIKALDPEYEAIVDQASLTDREIEILQLIVRGCSNATIADTLVLTVGTIKTHAAVLALRAGIIE